MRYDLYYIKHMSAWLDLGILAGTVWRVLAGGDTADRPAQAPAHRVGRLLQGRLFRQEKTMRKRTAISTGFVLAALLVMPSHGAGALGITFGRGDVFVSLENGPVQWWLADGTAARSPAYRRWRARAKAWRSTPAAICTSPGGAPTRWASPATPSRGSTASASRWARSAPATTAIPTRSCSTDRPNVGIAYVGQAGCRKSILKFVPGQTAPTEFMSAEDSQGIFWMDLAPDRCTMFYTSVGPNVKRFDVCTNMQLADFNVARCRAASRTICACFRTAASWSRTGR